MKGFTIWLTGLSGSGKTTIAENLKKRLNSLGYPSYILDGDNVRKGLNLDLGFSEEDRKENIRRISEVANLFNDCGVVNIVAFISPYREGRKKAREICNDNFVEVYIDCPLRVCILRDPKGLYKKAINGEIEEFTGISSPYEPPEDPDIYLRTNLYSVKECVDIIIGRLVDLKRIKVNGFRYVNSYGG